MPMRVARKSEVAWRVVGGEVVVIHLVRRRIYGFNDLGRRVWQALEQPQTVDELEKVVASENLENGCSEVRRFLADLSAEDLIEVEGLSEPDRENADIVDFPGPRIEWREELQRFAGMCQLVPGQHPACSANPGGS